LGGGVTTRFAALTGPNNLSTYCTKETLQYHKAKLNALNSKHPACNLQVPAVTNYKCRISISNQCDWYSHKTSS